MDDPPHIAVAFPPDVHCGIVATAHLPVWFLALPLMTPCPQTAEGQVAIVPLSSPAFQSFEKSATFLEAAPLTDTVQACWPLLMANHWAPDCHSRPWNQPVLCGGKAEM